MCPFPLEWISAAGSGVKTIEAGTTSAFLIRAALSGHKVKHATQCRALGLVKFRVTTSVTDDRAISGGLDIKYFGPEAAGYPDLADVKFKVLAFRAGPLFIFHSRSSQISEHLQ